LRWQVRRLHGRGQAWRWHLCRFLLLRLRQAFPAKERPDRPRPRFTTIFSGLAAAFGVNGSGHAEIDGTPAWQIGEYNPSAAYRFPVVAMIESQAGRIERAIGQLAAIYKNPFFVLLPSAPAVTQSVQDVALRNGAKVFAYEDLIEFANDAIQVRGSATSILSELAAGWIKNIDGNHGETRYPTSAASHTLAQNTMCFVERSALGPPINHLNKKPEKSQDSCLRAFKIKGQPTSSS
jgi:hypothetical protein